MGPTTAIDSVILLKWIEEGAIVLSNTEHTLCYVRIKTVYKGPCSHIVSVSMRTDTIHCGRNIFQMEFRRKSERQIIHMKPFP